MSKSILERRLIDVSGRAKRLRAELEVADEQLAFLSDEADEARLRSLVAETPLSDSVAREAQRHADAHANYRASLARSISELESEQDVLLERLAIALSDAIES